MKSRISTILLVPVLFAAFASMGQTGLSATQIAALRVAAEQGAADAEFALLVSDAWHDRGLGTELLRRLIDFARHEGIRRITGDILSENRAMIEICHALGFETRYSPEDLVVKAMLTLGTEPLR